MVSRACVTKHDPSRSRDIVSRACFGLAGAACPVTMSTYNLVATFVLHTLVNGSSLRLRYALHECTSHSVFWHGSALIVVRFASEPSNQAAIVRIWQVEESRHFERPVSSRPQFTHSLRAVLIPSRGTRRRNGRSCSAAGFRVEVCRVVKRMQGAD